MQKVFSCPLQIPSCFIDWKERLRPSNFLWIAQELAGKAASEIGFGHEEMQSHGLAWIISRIHLDFLKAPKWGQMVDFQTWHKGVEQVFFRREYRLVDSGSAEPLICGTCSWLAMKTPERVLFRTDRLSDYFDTSPQSTESAVEQPAGKIRIPRDLPLELALSHTIRYSDIDNVGHANNASYINWSMDCLPEELSMGLYPRSLDINYNLETRLGSTIELYRGIRSTPASTEVYIEGRVEQVPHFVCKLVF